MEKVKFMTPEQRRREIAYKKQSLKSVKGNIPDYQYRQFEEMVNKEIKELEEA